MAKHTSTVSTTSTTPKAQDNQDPSGVKTTIKNFAECTSIKGIPKAFKTEKKTLWCLWVLASLIGSGIGITLVIQLFLRYSRYETSTNVKACNDCRAPFPDVTLCNLNPLNSLTEFSDDILSFNEYISQIYNYQFDDNEMRSIQATSFSDEQLEEIYDEEFSLSGYFQNINRSAIQSLIDKEARIQMILMCQWYGWNRKDYSYQDCEDQSIYTFYSPEYFVCYTIHLNETSPGSSNVDVSSLQALIYLNDFAEQIMPVIKLDNHHSQARGLRVFVHPPNTLPEMEKGINVPPGHEIQIQLNAKQHKRKEEPYSDCTIQEFLSEDQNQETENLQTITYKYSSSACQALCLQQEVIDACQCFNPHLPYSPQMEDTYGQLPQCGWIGPNLTESIEYGWNRKDYSYQDCEDQSIYTFYSPEYFVCYTIHLNETSPGSSNVDVSSLQALIYLNDFAEQIMPVIKLDNHHSQARGLRVFVHPPNTLPEMEKGINVPPGHEIQIQLNAKQHKRKEEPYSDCTIQEFLSEDQNQETENLQTITYKYSSSACQALCLQQEVIDACQCFNPHLPYSPQMEDTYGQLPQCGWIGPNLTESIERVACYLFGNDNEDNLHCNCNVPCDEFTYDFKTFASPWPHEAYQPSMYRDIILQQSFKYVFEPYEEVSKLMLNGSVSEGFKLLQELDLIERNFIQLKIVYKEPGYDIYESVPICTVELLFGSLGGVLNLWVGVTFFTFIEMVDLCYRLLEIGYKRFKSCFQRQASRK